jgi:hypothetical protein
VDTKIKHKRRQKHPTNKKTIKRYLSIKLSRFHTFTFMKSIIINPFTDQELQEIKSWLSGNNFPLDMMDFLSGKMLVVLNQGIAIYRICIYDSNSPICWIGWELANPKATRRQKKGGLDFLIKEACNYAKYNGYNQVFTTSDTPGVQSKLEANGFKQGDSKVTHYIKKI